MHDSRHTELMNLACKSAILNRSVSHLIFPDEVPKRELAEQQQAGTPEGRLPSRNIAPPEDALNAAIDLLRKSKRPVIVVGHGARYQMETVVTLAEQLKAPVITTFKAKGQISDSHPLAGGVLGRSGNSTPSMFRYGARSALPPNHSRLRWRTTRALLIRRQTLPRAGKYGAKKSNDAPGMTAAMELIRLCCSRNWAR
jgi:hypothetical protein